VCVPPKRGLGSKSGSPNGVDSLMSPFARVGVCDPIGPRHQCNCNSGALKTMLSKLLSFPKVLRSYLGQKDCFPVLEGGVYPATSSLTA
jgi:hypothetical protein